MTSLLDAPPAGPQGDQLPRIWTAPPSLSSAGAEAVELARAAGLALDPWQCWVLDQALGERQDGRWSAFEVGVVVGRQNGKGAILEARELAGLFLFGEQLILHTAHQFKTSSEAFRRVRSLVDNTDALRKRVRRVLTGKGDEAIELKSGQRLRFIARSKVSGRGFSGDCVILDEAFELPEASIAALLPTMSARPNPQLWYTSSAVDRDHHKEGHVLARLRQRGIAGEPGLTYAEWSAADRDCLTDADLAQLRTDRRAWAQANPGKGIRITEEFIGRELASLAAKSFEVERLGIGDWPTEDVDRWLVIPRDQWLALIDMESQPIRRPHEVAFAVEMSWDRSSAVIGVCGRREDGLYHVEIPTDADGRADYRSGPPHWLPPRLKQLVDQWRPARVVINGKGPAGTLIADIEALGVEVYQPTYVELGQAFGRFRDTVEAGGLRHLNEPVLSTALAGAVSRKVGDAHMWDMKEASTDSAPLIVATNALWGLATAPAPQRFFASYR